MKFCKQVLIELLLSMAWIVSHVPLAESKGLRGDTDANDELHATDRRLTSGEIITIENGEYLSDDSISWEEQVFDNRGGFYACGAEIRLQSLQGNGDDTSANGLRMRFCSLLNWHDKQQTLTIHEGDWGSWRGMKMCPMGAYIQGTQVRFDPHGGHDDDTAMNGLKIFCRNPDNGATTWITVDNGNFGDWRSPKYFPSGKYAKGAQIRYDPPGGHSDNTAWQGLRFIVDKLHFGVSTLPVLGEWVNVASANNIQVSLSESMTISNSKTNSREFTHGYSQQIEHGFEASVGAGVEGKVSFKTTVGANQAFTTSRQVASTIAMTTSREFMAWCPDAAESPTGIWFIWQWRMSQESNIDGPGFEMLSSHWRCTPSSHEPPVCPLGFCADGACQTCLEPFDYLGAMSTLQALDGSPILYQFTLVNADTDQDVETLSDGSVIDTQALPNFNIRADTGSIGVGSVVFWIDEAEYRTEGVAPYALAGDSSGDYRAWPVNLGRHKVSAAAFTESGGKGVAGPTLTVSIQVV